MFRKIKEMTIHHSCSILAFGRFVIEQKFTGLAMALLKMEINSIFLHARFFLFLFFDFSVRCFSFSLQNSASLKDRQIAFSDWPARKNQQRLNWHILSQHSITETNFQSFDSILSASREFFIQSYLGHQLADKFDPSSTGWCSVSPLWILLHHGPHEPSQLFTSRRLSNHLSLERQIAFHMREKRLPAQTEKSSFTIK